MNAATLANTGGGSTHYTMLPLPKLENIAIYSTRCKSNEAHVDSKIANMTAAHGRIMDVDIAAEGWDNRATSNLGTGIRRDDFGQLQTMLLFYFSSKSRLAEIDETQILKELPGKPRPQSTVHKEVNRIPKQTIQPKSSQIIMGISINTNIAASRKAFLASNHANLQKSLDRLSSGRRITEPRRHDAGGLAVAMKMNIAFKV